MQKEENTPHRLEVALNRDPLRGGLRALGCPRSVRVQVAGRQDLLTRLSEFCPKTQPNPPLLTPKRVMRK